MCDELKVRESRTIGRDGGFEPADAVGPPGIAALAACGSRCGQSGQGVDCACAMRSSQSARAVMRSLRNAIRVCTFCEARLLLG